MKFSQKENVKILSIVPFKMLRITVCIYVEMKNIVAVYNVYLVKKLILKKKHGHYLLLSITASLKFELKKSFAQI